MLYQFVDWRIGLFRRMLMCDVERTLNRLREVNVGTLPYCLSRWEQVLVFAGECGIPLPEMQAVAENMMPSEAYPTMQWVREQYEVFLKYLERTPESRNMLVDPPRSKVVPTITDPIVLAKTPATPAPDFDNIVEGSVSNTEVKECLEPSPPTSSPTSTSTGSPNTLLTDKKPSPQTRRHLTRI